MSCVKPWKTKIGIQSISNNFWKYSVQFMYKPYFEHFKTYHIVILVIYQDGGQRKVINIGWSRQNDMAKLAVFLLCS